MCRTQELIHWLSSIVSALIKCVITAGARDNDDNQIGYKRLACGLKSFGDGLQEGKGLNGDHHP